MTTENTSRRGALLGAATTVGLGAALAVAAGVLSGGSGVAGVLVGVVLTCASLGLGSLVLAWITEVSPAMSLMVALMTYTLQVVLLLAAYVVLARSAALADVVSGRWLGVTVIVTTVVWLVVQVQALRSSRQPYLVPASATGDNGSTEDAA